MVRGAEWNPLPLVTTELLKNKWASLCETRDLASLLQMRKLRPGPGRVACAGSQGTSWPRTQDPWLWFPMHQTDW